MFCVFPTCSEGEATSVIAAMRMGVIPVVSIQSGIDIDNYGFHIDSSISGIKDKIDFLISIDHADLRKRSLLTLKASEKYDKLGFEKSFEQAVVNTIAI